MGDDYKESFFTTPESVPVKEKCECIFLERTPEISSSEMKDKLLRQLQTQKKVWYHFSNQYLHSIKTEPHRVTLMEKQNKYKYLAKNTLLFTISSFGSKILVFLLVPLYTSVLTTAQYGVADIISTSASMLTYVFTLDIASSILRFAIEQRENQYRIFRLA